MPWARYCPLVPSSLHQLPTAAAFSSCVKLSSHNILSMYILPIHFPPAREDLGFSLRMCVCFLAADECCPADMTPIETHDHLCPVVTTLGRPQLQALSCCAPLNVPRPSLIFYVCVAL